MNGATEFSYFARQSEELKLPYSPSLKENTINLSRQRIPLSLHQTPYKPIPETSVNLEVFKTVPKSKSSSKSMQQTISKSQPFELNQIIEYILSNILELMTDVYGNYICQTLFHNCSASHRLQILQALRGNLSKIANHTRGTHSLQNLIAMMNLKEEEDVYFLEFKGKIAEMSKKVNSSHVIQKLLETASNKHYITRELKNHVLDLATDKLGVCVLKKCCNDPQIMSEILGNSLVLMQHPYGNYAIQSVLDLWKEEAAHEFNSAIQGRVSQLCLQKYSSNVMEKALKIENIRKSIIKELVGYEKISELLMNQYGAYVLRTTSECCESEFKHDLFKIVNEVTKDLHCPKLNPIWREIIKNLKNYEW